MSWPRQGARREAREDGGGPAGDLRRRRRRHGIRGARGQGDGAASVPLLHPQRVRLLVLPQLRSACQARIRAIQR